VTVAAGFLCDEGIALAADMKCTDEGAIVYYHSLFNLRKRSGFTASIAGAGDYDAINAITGGIDNCLPETATLDEISEIVTAQNATFLERRLLPSPAPASKPLDYSLLIGISSPAEGMRLLMMNRDGTERVDRYEIVGSAQGDTRAFVGNRSFEI